MSSSVLEIVLDFYRFSLSSSAGPFFLSCQSHRFTIRLRVLYAHHTSVSCLVVPVVPVVPVQVVALAM